MPKPKPVVGVDKLLLLLAHHQARDKSVFLTEDNRLDFTTITLFQAYIGGRPAKFVNTLKGDASKDPLGEAEELQEYGQADNRPNAGFDFDSASKAGSDLFNNKERYNNYNKDLFNNYNKDQAEKDNLSNNNDLSNNNEEIFNSDNKGGAEDKTIPNSIAAGSHTDSRYSSKGGDVTITEDRADYQPIEIEDSSNLFQRSDSAPVLDNVKEEIQKQKVLYYKDITLQIIQNPKLGERDLLTIEVFLWYYKEANNKPKLYIPLPFFTLLTMSLLWLTFPFLQDSLLVLRE